MCIHVEYVCIIFCCKSASGMDILAKQHGVIFMGHPVHALQNNS